MASKGNHSRRGSNGSATAVKIVLLACVLLVMAVAGSTLFTNRADVTPDTSAAPPAADTPAPPATSADNLVTTPETPAATTPNAPVNTGGGTALAEKASDIGRDIAVPESAAVDDSYFNDAVFIGDSRTEGLKTYSGLPASRFWSKVGLTVDTAFSDQFVVINNQWLTVAQALQQADYKKVYIMLGMNELGWVYESKYAESYGRLIDVIQQSHPDAEIYVQSIIPVSKWLDSNPEQNRGYNTMANVIRLQKALVEMVKGKEGVHYVNVAECMEDSQGYLFSDSTQDGLHLNAEYCRTWMQYLRTHTVQ